MKILAFDTCLGACSVAVGADVGSRRARVEAFFQTRDTGHAEQLMPMMAEALANARLSVADLDRLAVTIGPGTFTGTRIGVAAARALALSTGLPVVGATSLAVMAQEAAEEIEDRDGAELLVAVDARRGEVYAQLFGTDGLDARSTPLLLTVAGAAALGLGPMLVVGSGAEAVAAERRARGRNAEARLTKLQPDACTLLYMAERMAPAGQTVRPLYLREPDAKAPLNPSLAKK